MSYCILRTKKLKGFSAVVTSAKHTYREKNTPNADPLLTQTNRCTGAKSSTSLLAALRNLLPERRRKDAVLVIEYLVTASPEFFQDATADRPHTRAEYFNASLEFLRNIHGKSNVLSAALHLDETTPHLVVYVVPLNASGKLCAKDFLGGRDKLRRLQTAFFERVGARFGLERGIKGSRANHQTVKRFYSEISAQSNLKTLNLVDKIASVFGFKTNTSLEREREEQALLAHSKAHGRTSMLIVKANQSKTQARYEAELHRSESLLTNLENERKSKANLENELNSARQQNESVKQQAIDMYERNQHLQSLAQPTPNSPLPKEKNVPKTCKPGLAN